MPAPKSDAMLVRVKPYNPRRGYVMRTYVDGQTGAVFKEERGWYEVDDQDLIERLREVTSRPDREESPLAFDVCTREEAIELERRIRRQQQERASAVDPLSVEGASRDHVGGRTPRHPAARDRSTLTTTDLPRAESPLRGELNNEPADENDLESEDLAADVAAHSARTAPAARRAAAPKTNAAKKGGASAKASTPPPAPGAPAVPGAPVPGGILPGGGDGNDE